MGSLKTRVSVFSFFVVWAAAQLAAQSFSLPSRVVESIRREASAPPDGPDGHPLPLLSSWNAGFTSTGNTLGYQLQRISEGNYLLPVIQLPHYAETVAFGQGFQVDRNHFQTVAAARLPLGFRTTQPEPILTELPRFRNLPSDVSPLVKDLAGLDKLFGGKVLIDVLAPSPDPFVEAGALWTTSAAIKELQQVYPDPPLVLIISNNEGTSWGGIGADSLRYHQRYGGMTVEGERLGNDLCDKIVEPGGFDAMHEFVAGIKSGLSPAWRAASKVIAFNEFGIRFYARWIEWRRFSGVTNQYFFCPNVFGYEGTSYDYYTDGGLRDYTVSSVQAEGMNLRFQQEKLRQIRPDYWFEMSVWDGEAPKRTSLSFFEPFDELRYVAMTRSGMWVLKPRIVREFRSFQDGRQNYGTYYEGLMRAVREVHEIPELTRFWRDGELVSNPSRPHPYHTLLWSDFVEPNIERRYLLSTTGTPAPTHYGMPLNVLAIALVRGSSPAREWLVHAQGPLGRVDDVEVTIPGYGVVTVDVPVGGAYYVVNEGSLEARLISVVNENGASLINHAPDVQAVRLQGNDRIKIEVEDGNGIEDLAAVDLYLGDDPESVGVYVGANREQGIGCWFKYRPQGRRLFAWSFQDNGWREAGQFGTPSTVGDTGPGGCAATGATLESSNGGASISIALSSSIVQGTRVFARVEDLTGAQSGWMSFGAIERASQPVAAWTFDETGTGPGTVLIDSTGNGHDATTSGDGTSSVDGVVGLARAFNGTTDRASLAADPMYGRSFSLSTWVQPDVMSDSFTTIVSNFAVQPDRGWYFGLLKTSQPNLAKVLFCVVAGGRPRWLVSNTALPLRAWNHITVTVHEASRRVIIYVNGQRDKSVVLPELELISGTFPVIGGANWRLGRHAYGGKVDQMELFEVELNSAEIANRFTSFPPPPAPLSDQPVAAWTFDETGTGPGTVLIDSTGNGHDATTSGDGTSSVDGVVGLARAFNGTTDRASLAADPMYGRSFSLSTWVQPDVMSDSFTTIVSNFAVQPDRGWYFGLLKTSQPNLAKVLFCVVAGGRPRWLVSNTALPLRAWNHITVTVHEASRRVIIYVNGQRDKSVVLPELELISGTFPVIGGANWRLGRHAYGGKVDQMELFEVELNSAEIANRFTSFPPPPAPLSDQPVAAWTFDETGTGPGTVLIDSTGNGHDATTSGDGTSSVDGVVGLARAFNGTTDRASLAADPMYGRSFSLSTWVQPDVMSDSFTTIVSNFAVQPDRGWYFGLLKTSQPNLAKVLFCVVAGGRPRWLVSNTALPLRAWNHITVTVHEASRRVIIYVNGQRDKSVVLPELELISGTFPVIGGANWRLGRHAYGGKVDQMELFEVELNSAEIANRFTSFPPPPAPLSDQPVAAWTFDETGTGPGTVLIDSTGNGHDATTSGDGTSSVDGVVGLARAFNGTTDRASLAADPMYGRSFSLSTWVQPDVMSDSFTTIVSNFAVQPDRGWYFGLLKTSQPNLAKVLFCVVAGGRPRWLVSNTALPLRAWNHITVTVHEASRRVIIYVNGQRDKSVVLPELELISGTFPVIGGANWRLGRHAYGGKVDQMELFEVELNSAEIANRFTSFPPPPAPLSDQPVAAWTFDETGTGPGTVLIDSTGNGHDATTSGDGTSSVDGVVHFGASRGSLIAASVR